MVEESRSAEWTVEGSLARLCEEQRAEIARLRKSRSKAIAVCMTLNKACSGPIPGEMEIEGIVQARMMAREVIAEAEAGQ